MNKGRHLTVKIAVLAITILCGCATTGKLMKLQLELTKNEVIERIGPPTAARGSITNKYGQVIEVWEYGLYKTVEDALNNDETYYWLFFYDSKLVQWGEAGDWEREADRIYEMRFR